MEKSIGGIDMGKIKLFLGPSILLLVSGLANADVVRYQYSSVITDVVSTGSLSGFLVTGDIVTGYFTVDTSLVPGISPDLKTASYGIEGVGLESFNAGGLEFLPQDGQTLIRVPMTLSFKTT